MKKRLINEQAASTCYFRTSTIYPKRKALVQITEKCNLNCKHCFVSATNKGRQIDIEDIEHIIIPKLKKCEVISVTLTGGEPFLHHDIISIVSLLNKNNISVGICSNASIINKEQIEKLSHIKNVHINVSLDGFSSESHGKFRGNENLFEKTIDTIKSLGKYRLLQGILVTPNKLVNIDEYSDICLFAIQNHAKYVLFNPLSPFGRGLENIDLGISQKKLEEIERIIEKYKKTIEIVKIRFPNTQKLPLSPCEAGKIFYIFATGDIAICPYLVFASKIPQSIYSPEEFIIGNVFKDTDINERINVYDFKRQPSESNIKCQKCQIKIFCGKGCPAAVIASGKKLNEIDEEICPYSLIN
ncbi:MAG: radical SAM protein [Candidatus Pacebacteria bacterium]|nr:radical SAM protein [Candidatus Paceibacterota bacterium]